VIGFRVDILTPGQPSREAELEADLTPEQQSAIREWLARIDEACR
jgi:hypothetical protein